MASVDLNSQSRQPPIFWNHLVAGLRSIPRVAVLSMVGPSVLCVVGYFGWLFYGAHNLDMAYYGLKKENVYLTSQPPWIRNTRVLDAVFEQSSLSRLSLLDAKTPGYLASVFDAHPWVRRTTCVQPMAGGVKIDVEYRKPVAMVACQRNGKWGGFFPIDVDSVLLDSRDFIENRDAEHRTLEKKDTENYIWIYVLPDGADTNRLQGQTFGDSRIAEAAKLCSFLLEDRERCRISRINIYPKTNILEIRTVENEGPTFIWGSAFFREGLGEVSPHVKLAKLREVVSDNQRWKPGVVDLSGAMK